MPTATYEGSPAEPVTGKSPFLRRSARLSPAALRHASIPVASWLIAWVEVCVPYSLRARSLLKDPSTKYRPFAPIDLANRQWPSRQLTQVPVWCSTDLRDGNQALFEPMSRETKKRLFKVLCAVGLKEIEESDPVGFGDGFPNRARSRRAEARAGRRHIDGDHAARGAHPAAPSNRCAARGARSCHVYNATAPVWRRVVFGMSTMK